MSHAEKNSLIDFNRYMVNELKNKAATAAKAADDNLQSSYKPDKKFSPEVCIDGFDKMSFSFSCNSKGIVVRDNSEVRKVKDLAELMSNK